jgi:UDP-N-acetylmuramoyl-tripeptide--D-alanyl-D-alanine ligase
MTTGQLYEIFLRFPAISTDSRKIIKDSLFFALKGDSFDGNSFAATALEQGAVKAVVDDPKVVTSESYILVEDVLISLQQLAAYHRKKLGLPIIAITGTNGKTTTKELIASVLHQKFRIEYTRGNLNNHIGVPLTLLTFTKETEIGVVEMGANHPGEIDFLCRLADPDFGLITNVGIAHLEGFGSFEGVVKTKLELYSFLDKKKGTIFINRDNPVLMRSNGYHSEKITYGTSPSTAIKGELCISFPFLCVKFCFNRDSWVEIETQLFGAYNFENVLAAVTIGHYFGVKPPLIKYAIEEYVPSNSRSQFIRAGTNIIILDAYNANPSSMQASIASFRQIPADHKCFMLGDMLELGENSETEHQNIVDLLASDENCTACLVGPCFSKTIRPDRFLIFNDANELILYLADHPLHDNAILIKGSHGIRMEKLAGIFNG